MNQIKTFTKKEFLELYRTGKFAIIAIIAVIFGIMNPAIAKLTPFLYKTLGKQMAEQGITINEVKVTALDSWGQFYKNIPVILIVFAIMFSGILVNELNKGTLINLLAKGCSRWKIIVSKTFAVTALWTVCYCIMYGITYGYTAYYWDNKVAIHIFLSAVLVYLAGVWMVSLIMLFSSLASQNYTVMLLTGGACVLSYVLSFIQTISKYMPTYLLKAFDVVNGKTSVSEFACVIIITIAISVVNIIVSLVCFNRKRV